MSRDPIPQASAAIDITTHGAEETRRFGESVGRQIDQKTLVFLSGDLGAGKTVFVQGLARGLDVPADYYITSPTYALVNEYPGRLKLFHADLYRISSALELEDMGFDDLAIDHGVLVVEWAERMGPDAPVPDMGVSIRVVDDSIRKITLFLYGRRNTNLVKVLSDKNPV